MVDNKSEISNVVVKGSIFNLISGTLVKFIGILFYILIYKYLGDEAGLYMLGISMLGLAQIISQVGIIAILSRYIPLYIGQNKKEKVKPLIIRFGSYLLLTTITVSVLVAFHAITISQMFNRPEFVNILYLISLALPFSIFLAVCSVLLRGIREYSFTAVVTSIQSIMKITLAVAFIFFVSRTAFDMLLASIIAFVTISIIMGIYTYLKFKQFPKANNPEKINNKELFGYGVPIYISSFGGYLTTWTDTLVIGLLMSDWMIAAYSSVGLIARNIGPVISRPFSSIVQPLLANLKGQESKYFDSLIVYQLRWLLLLGLPVLIVFVSLSFPIINLLFPENGYAQYHWLLWIMGPTFFMTLIATPFRDYLWAEGKSKVFMWSALIIIVPNIALNWILIPIYGLLGAAVASAITYVLGQGLFIYYGWKENGIWFDMSSLKLFIIAGSSIAVSLLLQNYYPMDLDTIQQAIRFVSIAVVTLIFYSILVMITIKIKPAEKEIINKMINKIKKYV